MLALSGSVSQRLLVSERLLKQKRDKGNGPGCGAWEGARNDNTAVPANQVRELRHTNSALQLRYDAGADQLRAVHGLGHQKNPDTTHQRAARAETERRAPRGRSLLSRVGRHPLACSGAHGVDRVG